MYESLLFMFTCTLHFTLGPRLSSSQETSTLKDDRPSSTVTTPVLELGDHCLKLPSIDHPSFTTLINQKCYVDKTEYLYKFVLRKENDPIYFFLSRPRRFGKTLLVDTLEMFFRGERDLFKGTYIYVQLPETWIKYPVIRIDFSGGILSNSVDEFKTSLLEKLQNLARENSSDNYRRCHWRIDKRAKESLL